MSKSRLGNHESADNSALEQLVADIMVAVLSLEYGAVTVSVKNGQVVQLERHEKRRLAKSPPPTFQLESYAP